MAYEEKTDQVGAYIEMPAPTPWPLVAALGVTLGFAGLVTSVAVTIVGVICAFSGAVGWWYDVLPQQKLERIPVLPPARRAAPVISAPQKVEHLIVGKGHRVRLPIEIHPYSAGLKGGIAGGIAMAVLAELYGLIAYDSLWYPINLLAAVAVPSLSQASVEQLVAFSSLGLGVAVIMHAVISLFVGLLYAVILPMLPSHPAFWGGLVGPFLWSGLIWASLGVINPALSERIDWVWFIASQIAFGLMAGLVIARSEPIETMQTWPLAERAGVEAPGLSPEHEKEQ